MSEWVGKHYNADVRFPTSLTGDGTDAMYVNVLLYLAALHEIVIPQQEH